MQKKREAIPEGIASLWSQEQSKKLFSV